MKPPKGYRVLRVGEILRAEDKYRSESGRLRKTHFPGMIIVQEGEKEMYFRKLKPTKKKK